MGEMLEFTLDAIRVGMGLNAPLLAQLIAATPEETKMIEGRAVPTAALVKRAQKLVPHYTKWRDEILSQMTRQHEVTSRQLSQMLHLSMWSVYQMINRSLLKPTHSDQRQADALWRSTAQHWFDEETVKAAFAQNEAELKDVSDKRRTGVFGRAFSQYAQDSGVAAKLRVPAA